MWVGGISMISTVSVFFVVGADEANGGVGRLSLFFPCDNCFVCL